MKKKVKIFKKFVRPLMLVLSLLVIFILGPYLFYYVNYMGKIFPNIYIEGVNVGGLLPNEALNTISKIPLKTDGVINLSYQDKSYKISGNSIDLKPDYTATVKRAFYLTRTNNPILDVYSQIGQLFTTKNLSLEKTYSENKLEDFINNVVNEIDIYPVEPKFTFDGKKVTEFQTGSNGLAVDKSKLTNLLRLNIGIDTTINIPVAIVYPNTSNNQADNFGIKELIGTGNSTYFHSIPGRVFNVNLAASRINGTLVAPGNIFSFNQTLGDVSKFTGYQQAYIIQNGKTVLGDGGGVCQVSTTLFRAVMNSGLPINERTAHAYRVGYYEQNSPPGMDATVYGPEPDFKFTNDTGNYVLIEAKNDPAKYSLTFEIYGTKDGRSVEITKPILTNYSPPPPDVYQDDPTLPNGTVRQTEFAASGAKVEFNYLVERNGATIFSKTFVSNYQPWANVFLKGTKN